MTVHAFICECDQRGCRLRVRISPVTFDRITKLGRVLHPDCVEVDRLVAAGKVISRNPYGGYVIAEAKLGSVAA